MDSMTTPLLEGLPARRRRHRRVADPGIIPQRPVVGDRPVLRQPAKCVLADHRCAVRLRRGGALRNPFGRIAIGRRRAVGCAAQVPSRRQRGRQDRHEKLGGQRLWSAVRRRTRRSRGCASTAAPRSDSSRDWSTSTRRSTTSCCRRPARRARCRRARNCRPGGLSRRHDTGGRRCAHGRAASICAPSDSSVASSLGRPTS